MKDKLYAGSSLSSGDSLCSENGKYELHVEKDASIYIMDTHEKREIWRQSKHQQDPVIRSIHSIMNIYEKENLLDGNSTAINSESFLQLDNYGNLIFYEEGRNKIIYSTLTSESQLASLPSSENERVDFVIVISQAAMNEMLCDLIPEGLTQMGQCIVLQDTKQTLKEFEDVHHINPFNVPSVDDIEELARMAREEYEEEGEEGWYVRLSYNVSKIVDAQFNYGIRAHFGFPIDGDFEDFLIIGEDVPIVKFVMP